MIDKISIAKQLINNNKFEEAINILNICKKVNLKNWEIFFELGKVYYIKKDFKKAIYNLEQSILLKDNICTKLLLAKSLKEFNNNFKALKLFFYIRKFDISMQKEIDTEIINVFLNKQSYFSILKYIDKYDIKDDILRKKILKLFIVQLSILNFKGDSFKVKQLSLKALKSLQNLDIKTKNALLNEIEISDNKTEIKTYPRIIKIGITQNCNLKCKMCLNHIQKNPYGKLTKTNLKILEILFKYAEFVEWQGGEPFICKDIEYFIDLANKNNVSQSIITNGLLLNEKIIKKIINYNFELTISIDSVDKKIYENIRYGGKFDTLLKNVECLYKYRKLYNNTNKLKLNAVLSRWNYQNEDNFFDIIKFANKYNFTDMDIYCDCCEKDNCLKMKYIEKFNLNRNKLLSLANEYNINLSIQVPMNFNSNNIDKNTQINMEFEKYCLLPWKKIFINFNKLISVDCQCPTIGVLESNTKKFFIDNIWNGEKIMDIREKIVNNKIEKIKSLCKVADYKFLRKG